MFLPSSMLVQAQGTHSSWHFFLWGHKGRDGEMQVLGDWMVLLPRVNVHDMGHTEPTVSMESQVTVLPARSMLFYYLLIYSFTYPLNHSRICLFEWRAVSGEAIQAQTPEWGPFLSGYRNCAVNWKLVISFLKKVFHGAPGWLSH